MKIEEYLHTLNKEILDIDINLIYNNCKSKEILSRTYNQLRFFESKKLEGVIIADVGSGLGIHANYFYNKGAIVTCYEPNFLYCEITKKYFPHLNVINSLYEENKMNHFITLFGGVYYFLDNYSSVFKNTKFTIIDIVSNLNNLKLQYPIDKIKEKQLNILASEKFDYLYQHEKSIIYKKIYYDEMRKRNRTFQVYLNK